MGWDFIVTPYDHRVFEELDALACSSVGPTKIAALIEGACSADDRDPLATQELNADPTRGAWLRAGFGVLALTQPGVFLGRTRHLGDLEKDASKLENGTDLAEALAQVGAVHDHDLSEPNGFEVEQIRYRTDPDGAKRLGLAIKKAFPKLTELDPKIANPENCEDGLERLGQIALWAMKRELGLFFSHDEFDTIRRWSGSKPGPAAPLQPPPQFTERSADTPEESFLDLSSRTGGYVMRGIIAAIVVAIIATTIFWLYRKFGGN